MPLTDAGWFEDWWPPEVSAEREVVVTSAGGVKDGELPPPVSVESEHVGWVESEYRYE